MQTWCRHANQRLFIRFFPPKTSALPSSRYPFILHNLLYILKLTSLQLFIPCPIKDSHVKPISRSNKKGSRGSKRSGCVFCTAFWNHVFYFYFFFFTLEKMVESFLSTMQSAPIIKFITYIFSPPRILSQLKSICDGFEMSEINKFGASLKRTPISAYMDCYGNFELCLHFPQNFVSPKI